MKGYLAQIASAGGAGSTSMLRPLIRSRSPIAESDQRIGLSEWETPMLPGENETSASDAEVLDDITVVRADTPRAGLRQAPVVCSTVEPEPKSCPGSLGITDGLPILSAPEEPKPLSVASPLRKPRTRSSPEPRESSEPQPAQHENEPPRVRSAKADGPSVATQEAASAIPSQSRRMATSVALPSRPEPRAVDRGQDSPTGSKEAPVKHLEPEFSQPATEMVAVSQRDQPLRHPAAVETAIAKHREEKSSQRLSMPAAVAPSEPSRAQVVIDRLEIEVVPPPPQTAPKPPARSESGMGAARPQRPVSKIGPLSQSTAFRHYLSLRYR
jgi:hypothetical protein